MSPCPGRSKRQNSPTGLNFCKSLKLRRLCRRSHARPGRFNRFPSTGAGGVIHSRRIFNVETDPPERYNVAAANTAIVNELKAILNQFTTSITTEQTFWGPAP
jgi:hypothetical protein